MCLGRADRRMEGLLVGRRGQRSSVLLRDGGESEELTNLPLPGRKSRGCSWRIRNARRGSVAHIETVRSDRGDDVEKTKRQQGWAGRSAEAGNQEEWASQESRS